MRLFSEQKFVINTEMLHLAVELAAAQAAKIELERQFGEQHPKLALNFKDWNVDFSHFHNLAIDLDNFDVEYK